MKRSPHLAFLVGLMIGCSSTTKTDEGCTPAGVEPCLCADGASSIRECTLDRTFGPCSCGHGGAGGGAGALVTGGHTASGGGGMGGDSGETGGTLPATGGDQTSGGNQTPGGSQTAGGNQTPGGGQTAGGSGGDDGGVAGGGGASGAGGSLLQDCVLLFHMNEAEWTGSFAEVRDDSGLGNHGTAGGAINTTADGRFGRAGFFDGSGWIEVADAESLRPTTALTVAVWVWPSEISASSPGIVAKRVAYEDSNAFGIFLDVDGRLGIDVNGEDDRFQSRDALDASRWYHIALVYEGGLPAAERVKLYIDGDLDTTAYESSAAIAPYTPALTIGNLPNGGGVFTGRMDEVAIWRRSLTDREIEELSLREVAD